VYGFVRVLATEKHAQVVTEVAMEVAVELVAQLVVAIYGPRRLPVHKRAMSHAVGLSFFLSLVVFSLS